MIPIKLTLEGLYSYQSKQSIDFSKLTTDHIFGIFGSVGSGKSSILEAITFALYGKTDRLLLSGDNRNYNMMNLKSNQLFIEFDFYAGKDDQQFRVQITAKRNSKKFEDVKKADRIVYIKNKDNYKPITQVELEQVLGLSYDNFKRTIIIPQGKFQEFLQLKNLERTQMMKELFNLQKFEMSAKVKNLEVKNNASIQHIEGRLEQLGEVSNNQHQELKTQLKDTEKELQLITEKQKQLDESLTRIQKLKEDTDLLTKKMLKLSEFNKKKENILQLEKDVNSYEHCVINFKSTLNSIGIHQQKQTELKLELEKDIKLFHRQQEKLSAITSEFDKISVEYNNIEKRKKEVEDLTKLIETKSLTSKIKEETSRFEKGNATVYDVVNKIETLEKQEKKHVESLNILKKEQPEIEHIHAAQQWHSTFNTITKSTEEVQTNIKNNHQLIIDLEKKLNSKLSEFNTLLEGNDKKEWLITLKDKHSEIQKELSIVQKTKEGLLIKSGLEQFASELIAGSECPLCGSEHHPKPHDSKDIKKQIETLDITISTLESEIKKLIDISQLIDKYFASTLPIENQISELNKKLLQLNENLKTHHQSVIKLYTNESTLKNAIELYNNSKNNIDKTEKEIEKLRSEINKQISDKDRFQEALMKIQRQMDIHVNSKELLEKQIPSETIKQFKERTKEEINQSVLELTQYINETISKYEQLKKNTEELNKVTTITRSKIETNQNHLIAEEEKLNKLNKELTKNIDESPYESQEIVITILNKHLDIEASKQLIKNFNSDLQILSNEIEKLQHLIGDNIYEENKHQLLIKETNEGRQKLIELNRSHGKIQSTLTEIENKIILQKELKTQLDKLKLRAEDINILRKLFYKSGFVNYISSVYLQNLCTTANKRFYKMTRQQLSLELSDDNNFLVRDYMNGGKTRSVKTLSGGQTFQAALALALALADNIQNLAETNRNFFFLDEGFGSLDKDSLEIVFSTLKSLRNENRIVGVISHVEEMQQEISTYLKVNQDDELGSFIKESWKS